MKIIGHRGAQGLAPENTIAGLDAALAHNVDEIEVDIRVTSDNVAVLEHDDSLTGDDGKKYEVSEYPLAELRKLKADLPTLEAAITHVNKRTILHIEVKPNEKPEPVIAVIASFLAKGWDPALFIIGARDIDILQAFQKALPEVPLTIINAWSGVIATHRARKLGTKRISMNEHVMYPWFIKSMSKRGWLLSGYTMDDPKRARKWAKAGLYAVITDHPERFHD